MLPVPILISLITGINVNAIQIVRFQVYIYPQTIIFAAQLKYRTNVQNT